MMKNQILEMFPIGNPFPVDGDRRRYDPITAITGGAGLLGNIAGGFIGNSAAKKAAAAQAAAANQAKDLVGAAVGDANKPISDATAAAQAGVTTAGQQAVTTAEGARDAANTAATNANGYLNPYANAGNTAAGVLNSGLAQGGQFNTAPTLADLQMDPGAAWQRQQMEKAMQNSAAARGGALGGGAAMDLAKYEAGALSQDYQNAFNRFQQNRAANFNFASTTAGQGLDAAGKQSGNLMSAAQLGGNWLTNASGLNLDASKSAGNFGLSGANAMGDNTMRGAVAQGDYLTQAGNARAAGAIGGANAISGALSGGANAVTGALNTYNLLRNPALQPVRGAPAGTGPGLPPGVLDQALGRKS